MVLVELLWGWVVSKLSKQKQVLLSWRLELGPELLLSFPPRVAFTSLAVFGVAMRIAGHRAMFFCFRRLHFYICILNIIFRFNTTDYEKLTCCHPLAANGAAPVKL